MRTRRSGLTYIKHKENPTSFKEGYVPWNKGLKGYNAGDKHYNFGEARTDEVKTKISATKQGINRKDWRDFKNSFSYRERRKFHKTMQKQIFERDDYTCQLCGTRGGDLQVDHIQSWADYVELRFSMDNCRTLCASCHYKITYKKPIPKNIKGWGHNLMQKGGE